MRTQPGARQTSLPACVGVPAHLRACSKPTGLAGAKALATAARATTRANASSLIGFLGRLLYRL